MNNFQFFLKCDLLDLFKFPHYRKKTIRNLLIVKKETKKWFLIFDMIVKCYRLKASYEDYFWFKMYKKDYKTCEKFTNLGRHIDLFKKINKEENKKIFSDKPRFNEIFKEYINRDFIDLRTASLNDFKDFTNKHPEFIAKPAGGSSGYKVEKINIINYNSIENLFNELKENHCFTLEEIIIQHPKMASLHPESVNTIRIVTTKKDGVISFFKAALRIGTKDNVADNFNRNGIGCALSDNGTIISDGVTKDLNVIYTHHPDTNIKLQGFQIPNFEIAKETCIKAAQVLEMDLIGFDIAITDNGCVIVEANSTPLYDLTQMTTQTGEYHELLNALGLDN